MQFQAKYPRTEFKKIKPVILAALIIIIFVAQPVAFLLNFAAYIKTLGVPTPQLRKVYAAAPTVASEGFATDTNGNNGFAITLTGTPGSGDLYIIFLQSGLITSTWAQTSGTTGWTEMYDSSGQAVYYKQLTGSETPDFTSSAAVRAGATHLKITGHEDPSTQVPEVSAGATGTSNAPDPDTVTPAAGSDDYLYIAVEGNTDGRRSVTTGPSGYSTVVSFSTGGGAAGTTGGHAYLGTTGTTSGDPGTFALGGSTPWEARTIAVTPAAASTSYEQQKFEWFVSGTSVTLTDVWPAGGGTDLGEDEVFTQLPRTNNPLVSGDQIRIQMNFQVTGAALAAGTQAFELEYDQATDCDAATGWTSVGNLASGTIWRLFDETSIGPTEAQVNDIGTSTAGEEGLYSEINPAGTNPNLIGINDVSEWDWPVENNGATANTTYCFRMVLSGGTPLNSYVSTSYPQLTTAPDTPDFMRHGNFYSDQGKQGFYWTK